MYEFTYYEFLVVDSQSHHNDSVAIKTGAVAMGVGIRGYTVRFADSDPASGRRQSCEAGSIAIYRSHVGQGSRFEYLERRKGEFGYETR